MRFKIFAAKAIRKLLFCGEGIILVFIIFNILGMVANAFEFVSTRMSKISTIIYRDYNLLIFFGIVFFICISYLWSDSVLVKKGLGEYDSIFKKIYKKNILKAVGEGAIGGLLLAILFGSGSNSGFFAFIFLLFTGAITFQVLKEMNKKT